MNVRDERSRSVSLSLSGGTELRLSVVGEGDTAALVLAHGLADPFRRPSWAGDPITLPASVLPALREALEALEAGL